MPSRLDREAIRRAFESGFRWAGLVVTNDPFVPPERWDVYLGLDRGGWWALHHLGSQAWWAHWTAGFAAGARQRQGTSS